MKKFLSLFIMLLIGCSSTPSIPTLVDIGDGILVLEGSKKYFCAQTKDDSNAMKCIATPVVVEINKNQCNSLYPAPGYDPANGFYTFECWKK